MPLLRHCFQRGMIHLLEDPVVLLPTSHDSSQAFTPLVALSTTAVVFVPPPGKQRKRGSGWEWHQSRTRRTEHLNHLIVPQKFSTSFFSQH